MRVLILFLVVFLAVTVVQGAKKPKGKGKPSKPSKPEGGEKPEKEEAGICVPKDQMMMICAAGSSLEEKAPAAMEACDALGSGNERALDFVMNMRAKKPKGKGKGKPSKPGKGKGKGKPSKCPTAEKLIEEAAEKYSDEICMFTEIGWINNDMEPQEDAITADLMTLPSEMSDALTGDKFDECVTKIEEAAEEYGGKCFVKYTEEEQTTILAVLNGLARIECFTHMFDESCGLYMSNTLAAMAGNPGSGSGSG